MENKKIKVAVLGATGAVGQVFMWMLSDHPWFELSYVTASSARVGMKYSETVHWVMPFEMPSEIKDIEIKHILRNALTDKTNDREIYMKGIDNSYFYEGYATFKAEDL